VLGRWTPTILAFASPPSKSIRRQQPDEVAAESSKLLNQIHNDPDSRYLALWRLGALGNRGVDLLRCGHAACAILVIRICKRAFGRRRIGYAGPPSLSTASLHPGSRSGETVRERAAVTSRVWHAYWRAAPHRRSPAPESSRRRFSRRRDPKLGLCLIASHHRRLVRKTSRRLAATGGPHHDRPEKKRATFPKISLRLIAARLQLPTLRRSGATSFCAASELSTFRFGDPNQLLSGPHCDVPQKQRLRDHSGKLKVSSWLDLCSLAGIQPFRHLPGDAQSLRRRFVCLHLCLRNESRVPPVESAQNLARSPTNTALRPSSHNLIGRSLPTSGRGASSHRHTT